MGNVSRMSNEFHEWLDMCPAQWTRLSHDGDSSGTVSASYDFWEEQPEEEEED